MERAIAENGRILYLDVLKGLAAFLVVLGHLVTSKEEYSRLYNFIYSFHMPLFMFLAGCTVVISHKDEAGGKYLMKRFVNIMIPYFSWTVFLSVMFAEPFGAVDWNAVLTKTFISNRMYWFLPTLYGLIVCYIGYRRLGQSIGNRLSRDKADERVKSCIDFISCICIMGVVVFLMVVTKYQLFRDIVGFTIPFFAAILYMEHEWIHRLFYKWYMAVAALAVFALLIGRFDFDRISVMTSLLRMVLGMCAVVILLQIVERIPLPGWFSSLLVLWGQSSLLIYILHGHFIGRSGLLAIQDFGKMGNLAWYCALSFLACSICSIFARTLGYIPGIRVFFLGKTGGGRAKKG